MRKTITKFMGLVAHRSTDVPGHRRRQRTVVESV